MLTGLFKDARFGPFSNLHSYTGVFHLWKSVTLDNAWVKDFSPIYIFFHSRVFARLVMQQTRVFGVGIPNHAYNAL